MPPHPLDRETTKTWMLLVWLCLWGFCGSQLQAEGPRGRLSVRALTTQEGLPQNNIHALAMDQLGRLWVGTTEGAAYLDGSGWTSVDIPDDATSNFVTSILPSSDGAVWIGRQDGGVSRLFKGEWTIFSPAKGFVHPRVNALAETTGPGGSPIIWAGTHGAGLARYEDGKWTVLNHADGLPDDRIWRLYPTRGEDGSQSLWIGTDGGGVLCWEHGRLRSLPRLPEASVNAFLQSQDSKGHRSLWAGTYGFGVARLDGDHWTRFTQKEGLPSDFITDLAEIQESDGGTAIWVCTLRGLAVFRHDRWEILDKRMGLPGNITHRLLVRRSPEGSTRMWVGTGGFGLFLLEMAGWRKVDETDGLPDSSVHSLLEVDGDLYTGTALGLARYRSGKWETILAAERISALAATGPPGHRTLWVGSLGGLHRLEGGRWTHFGPGSELSDQRISSLYEVKGPGGASGLWIGTEGGGLVRFDGKTWRRFGPAEGFPSNLLSGLLEVPLPEGASTFWAGTRGGGIARFNPDGSWTRFGLEQGLPTLTVLSLGLVRRGGALEIWAGTQGKGVATLRLDRPGARWETLTLEALPPGSFNTVFGVLQTRNGDVFLTGTRGVVHLQAQGPDRFRARKYSIEDGLPSDFCTPRALLEDSAGRVVVGTVSGLAFLEPKADAQARAPSPLRLRSITAPGLSLLDGFEAQGLSLSHLQTPITFDYTLITLTRWRETKYQTQLVGMEASPTSWGAEHRREFTRLPPGQYQFLVWAKDHADTTSGPISFTFTVMPAPWETWWFYGLCLAVVVGLIWVGVRTRERLLLAHNRELAAMVSAQTGALQEANEDLKKEVQERLAAERVKDDFTSMVSHELRTPLTAIRGSLGLVASGALDLDPDTRKQMIEVSQRNTIRLLVLVNDLLDLQKIEAGRLSLHPVPVRLQPNLMQTVQANIGYAEGLGVTLELGPCPADLKVWADPLRLEQAFTNLISNAAKFSPRGGLVRISVETRPHLVRILFHNTGDPIPDAFRPQLFQKFSQSDVGTTRAVKGTGLGLAITKAIVDGLGGHIDFDSGPDGTTFWVELTQVDETGKPVI